MVPGALQGREQEVSGNGSAAQDGLALHCVDRFVLVVARLPGALTALEPRSQERPPQLGEPRLDLARIEAHDLPAITEGWRDGIGWPPRDQQVSPAHADRGPELHPGVDAHVALDEQVSLAVGAPQEGDAAEAVESRGVADGLQVFLQVRCARVGEDSRGGGPLSATRALEGLGVYVAQQSTAIEEGLDIEPRTRDVFLHEHGEDASDRVARGQVAGVAHVPDGSPTPAGIALDHHRPVEVVDGGHQLVDGVRDDCPRHRHARGLRCDLLADLRAEHRSAQGRASGKHPLLQVVGQGAVGERAYEQIVIEEDPVEVAAQDGRIGDECRHEVEGTRADDLVGIDEPTAPELAVRRAGHRDADAGIGDHLGHARRECLRRGDEQDRGHAITRSSRCLSLTFVIDAISNRAKVLD